MTRTIDTHDGHICSAALQCPVEVPREPLPKTCCKAGTPGAKQTAAIGAQAVTQALVAHFVSNLLLLTALILAIPF